MNYLLLSVFLCFGLKINVDSLQEFSKQKMERYRDKVKSMFYHAYDGYLKYAYPYDELKPLTCQGMDTWGSFSLTLIDALDTLVIMGNATEFERATALVLDAVDFDANVNVSVFETNIRVVGGLLSAHMLSGVAGVMVEDGWPCNGPLLRLAEKVANKLLPAFNTWTGMPYGTINLRHGVHRLETPITCTAGVGTYLLEFASLSRLTGNAHYERVAMKALSELYRVRSPIGLVGNHVNVQTGQWTATDSGIGAGVDSYFEYLVKGSILLNRPDLMKQFNDYKHSIQEYIQHEDWFLWVSMGKGHVTMPVFQSLEQFWPGVLTLVGDVDAAMRILNNYYMVLKQYGFSPEFFNVPTMEAVNKRSGYPLRPELVESLFYAYQATRDPLILRIAEQVVDAIEHSTKTRCGYATVVNVKDHKIEDRMESFFLSETTKYLYLLFDPDNFIHNPGSHGRIIDTPSSGTCVVETGGYVFNTEAHPMDPSLLACCSSQRLKETQLLQRFEDELDLISLFGLDDDEDEDGEDWILPGEQVPPVFYMPEQLEVFNKKRNRSSLASDTTTDTTMDTNQAAEAVNDKVEIEYSTRGSDEKISMAVPGTPPRVRDNKPSRAREGSILAEANGKLQKPDNSKPSIITEASGSAQRDGNPGTSWNAGKANTDSTKTTELTIGKQLQLALISAVKDLAVTVDALSNVSSLLGVTSRAKPQLAEPPTPECPQTVAEYSSLARQEQRALGCGRWQAADTESFGSFARLLRLMYAPEQDPLRVAAARNCPYPPPPVCLPTDEAGQYWDTLPQLSEDIDPADDSEEALAELELVLSKLSGKSRNIGREEGRKLGNYTYYKLMSCPLRPFGSRMFMNGEVIQSSRATGSINDLG